MNNTMPTMDLKGFGYMELDQAKEILNALQEHGSPDFMTDGLQIMFNQNSGSVFLTDEDFNVAVLSGDELVQFYNCPMCGYENTQEDALSDGKDFEKYNGYCSQSCEDDNN